jgi:hypothetical protein
MTLHPLPLSASHLSNARSVSSRLCSALPKTQHRFPSEQTLSRSRYLCSASKTALGAPANRYWCSKPRPTARPCCLVDRALHRFAAEHAVPARHIKQSTRTGTAKEGYRPHTSRENHRYPSEGVIVVGTTEGVICSA